MKIFNSRNLLIIFYCLKKNYIFYNSNKKREFKQNFVDINHQINFDVTIVTQ
jgi:hypothetical protein